MFYDKINKLVSKVIKTFDTFDAYTYTFLILPYVYCYLHMDYMLNSKYE